MINKQPMSCNAQLPLFFFGGEEGRSFHRENVWEFFGQITLGGGICSWEIFWGGGIFHRGMSGTGIVWGVYLYLCTGLQVTICNHSGYDFSHPG